MNASSFWLLPCNYLARFWGNNWFWHIFGVLWLQLNYFACTQSPATLTKENSQLERKANRTRERILKIKHRNTIQPNFLGYVHYTLHQSIRGYSWPKTQPWGLVDRSMPNFKILFLLIFCFAAVAYVLVTEIYLTLIWSRTMQKYGVFCKKAAMLKSIFQCPIRLGFYLCTFSHFELFMTHLSVYGDWY